MLTSEKQDLANDLLDRTKECHFKARIHSRVTIGLAIVSVFSSIFTTYSVLTELMPRGMLAAVAALPAIAVTVAAAFKFSEWRDWWLQRLYKLEALRRGILYEGRHESEVSKELSAFLARHEKTRPRVGVTIVRGFTEES